MSRRHIGLSVLCSLLAACGGGDDTARPPANVAPTTSAGPDRDVGKTTLVTLAGTGTDSDGSIASIRWTQTSGVSVILNASDTYAAYFTAPTVTTAVTLEFTLTVVDNQGASATDSIRVQVVPATWETGVALRDARWGLTACSLDNKIYVFGGADFDTLAEQFDISTQTWTTLPSMPVGRRYGHACAVVGSKIYVMGGYSMSVTPTLDNMEAFDTATNSWSVQPVMPTGRYNVAAVTLNGKVYAVGGRSNVSNTTTTLEEFDPASGTWSAKASIPAGRHSPAVAAIGGKLYATGGFGAANVQLDDAYEYDPATNTWRQLASMTTGRWAHSATTWNGRIYVFGGQSDPYSLATTSIEMYNPATNQWTQKSTLPTARQSHASVLVGSSVYILGGRETSQGSQPLVYTTDIYNPAQDN